MDLPPRPGRLRARTSGPSSLSCWLPSCELMGFLLELFMGTSRGTWLPIFIGLYEINPIQFLVAIFMIEGLLIEYHCFPIVPQWFWGVYFGMLEKLLLQKKNIFWGHYIINPSNALAAITRDNPSKWWQICINFYPPQKNMGNLLIAKRNKNIYAKHHQNRPTAACLADLTLSGCCRGRTFHHLVFFFVGVCSAVVSWKCEGPTHTHTHTLENTHTHTQYHVSQQNGWPHWLSTFGLSLNNPLVRKSS